MSTLEILDQIVSDGIAKGLGHLTTEDDQLNGRTIRIDGRDMLNFGSCSYLGLEKHPALIEGAIDAVRRYGTQFSSSRTYAQVGLYAALEDSLREMFGRPTVVSASTTLGHLAALPVVVGDNDAVVLDMQVHSSVQMAAQLLKARGIPLTIVKHNDMKSLERRVRELGAKHDKVWYLADGIYSMYGDAAPLDALGAMMDRHPKMHLYIDDAHGMSWAGEHGTGSVRRQGPHHDRMVLAVSLNKAFAAAGGALVFPTEEMAALVRKCGATLIFSGPIQPPMLGVALASARLHLSDEIGERQRHLAHLVAHMNRRLDEAGLPQFMKNDSPLFFVPAGLPKLNYDIIHRMVADGFYVNSACFPAVPMKRGGIRFTVTCHLTEGDIDAMVRTLAMHYRAVIAEAGITTKMIAKSFGIEDFVVKAPVIALAAEREAACDDNLTCEHVRSIDRFDPSEWDARFRSMGNFTFGALQQAESQFGAEEVGADKWQFHYFTVRDEAGQVILQTVYSAALLKDDMFEPAAVSAQVEAVRESDPDYLTSKAVLLGTMVTKGQHLFLDRTHASWKKALALLVAQMQRTQEAVGASQLMLRDFAKEQDADLQGTLLELGFSRLRLPDSHAVERLDWNSHDEYVARLGARYRSDLRREVLKRAGEFRVETRRLDAEGVRHAYRLYEAVFERALELNVHKLPFALFEAMAHDPAYDVIQLFVGDEARPAAVMFSHFEGDAYHAMFVGLDYAKVASHDVYKQILYRTVMRAREVDATRLDLAFTAKLAKRKVGATPQPMYAYVQLESHDNVLIMNSLSRTAALA